MADKFVKIFELNEKGIELTKIISKEEVDSLRGKIVIIDPEQSEIGKNLEIKSKGLYGARFK